MFGLLKKKITSFIDSLTKKEEQKPDEPEVLTKEIPHLITQAQPKARPTPASAAPTPTPPAWSPAPAQTGPTAKAPQTTVPAPKTEPEKPNLSAPDFFSKTTTPMPTSKPATQIPPAPTLKPQAQDPESATSIPSQPQPCSPPTPIATQPPKHAFLPPTPTESATKTASNPEQTPFQQLPTKPAAQTPAPSENAKTTKVPDAPKERKLEAKLGLFSQIKGLFTHEVQIQPYELEPMLEELNMALLESDVTLDTAEHIVSTIKTQLSGRKVEKSRIQAEIQAAVKTALVEVLNTPSLDLIDYIQQHEKPVKILFLGPNGAGKTTTLAKIAHYLKQNDVRCVLAAADTFRAAAIEQLQHHGTAIGVPVIKHQYGADPAAVAFDAIAHAKAHGLDVVLIDTAGRQETNYNLLKEMEKINRVVRPDLKLFIGEAVAGHALVEQAKAFHQSLKLDGVVLTKVDCDAKGGTSFSVSHEVGVPIVLLGTGQNYGDLRPFDAKWLVANVLAE